ncbi:MAG: hypothetical protein ABI867_24465 [Kofleriaceae bacterium]
MPMVRKARCPMCGSAKATPTRTAYIYCDYCGQLMDLDIEKYRAQAPVPSAEYQALDDKLAPRIEAAKATRNRTELTSLYRQLKELWVRDMATMFSPRINDPEFRAQMIEYLAFQSIVTDLSPKLAPLAEQLSEANAGMELVERGGRYVIEAKTLWPIIEAQRAAADVYLAELTAFPDAVADPDDTPPAVSKQLGASTYVGGFMTMVDDATAKELLQRTGLEAAYEHVPDPELHKVFCGHCGANHESPTGARRVLCEYCGKHADIGTAASCHSCNSKLVIGLGQTQATCAHCTAEVRLVAALT